MQNQLIKKKMELEQNQLKYFVQVNSFFTHCFLNAENNDKNRHKTNK